MINPRFLQLAKRQMNKEIPKSLDNLVSQDSKGKPKLNLTPMEKIVVYIPTKGSYNELMEVYECGGWQWYNGKLPTEGDRWKVNSEETCIEVGHSGVGGNKEEFGYGHKKWFEANSYEFLSMSDFYASQNPPITKEMLNEINSWFDQNDKS